MSFQRLLRGPFLWLTLILVIALAFVSTMNAPEVNDYPDSNKTWVRTFPPGGVPGDDEYELVLSKDATVDYLDGER